MKIKLVESFAPNKEDIHKIKQESLTESTSRLIYEGTEYKCVAAYTFPFSRPDKENLNGRIYTKKLWENVFKKQFKNNESTFGLMDHPEGDGSMKDIACVWRNPRFNEDSSLCIADCYLFGEHGRKIHEAIEAGGPVGFSTSGFGEIKESDNKTVNEDSFELERIADMVLTPSYSVFSNDESATKIKNESIQENVTINNKETEPMSDKLRELTEKTTRLNLNKLIEEADKKETHALRISALEEALSYTSDDFLADVKKTLEEKIAAIKAETFELAEKAKTLPQLEENVKVHESEKSSIKEEVEKLQKDLVSINEKYEVAVKLLDEAKEYAEKADSLIMIEKAEKGSRFSATEYFELVKIKEEAEKCKKEAEDEKEEIEKEVKESKERIASLEETVRKLRKSLAKKEEAIADYKAEIEAGLMNEEGEEPEIDYEDPSSFTYADSAIDYDSDLDIRNDDEVLEYYESLVSENKNYRKIKEDILKCKTLLEAQQTSLRLKDLVESVKMPSFLQDPSLLRENRISNKREDLIDAGKIQRKGWL